MEINRIYVVIFNKDEYIYLLYITDLDILNFIFSLG